MSELAAGLVASETDRLVQAESLVRGFCGWHITPSRTETVELRAVGGSVLVLPSLHVTAVTAVTDATTPLTVETEYTWSAAGVLTRLGYWGDGTIVEVEFTHGYDDAPADVEAVVQAVAQRALDNPRSLVRTQVGPFGDTYSTTAPNQSSSLALLESEKETLRRYRIPGVA
jgi:hypothetical protein